jgi:O-antigen ligase
MPGPADLLPPLRQKMSQAAVWLYLGILAWAPFPLGGAIAWAAGLQEILIAVCWLLWVLVNFAANDHDPFALRDAKWPLLMALAVLGWAVVQMLPIVPASWAHPLWQMTADLLGKPQKGVISIDPWATQAEILKLLSYVLACWLAYSMARRAQTAMLLFNAVIVIGVVYACYGFILTMAGHTPQQIFYSMHEKPQFVTGPFMLHNSFATYIGMTTLAAAGLLFSAAGRTIVVGRGLKPLASSAIQYISGYGLWRFIATLLCVAGLAASASRAGFFATCCGLAAMAIGSMLFSHRRSVHYGAYGSALAGFLLVIFLFSVSGDLLLDRINQLITADEADAVRHTLWNATGRMIADAPLLGIGLGGFLDTYPLYATHVLPYVIDKAHSDYLEFAAGLGLPAAVLWWCALCWLAAICGRGLMRRHRNREFPLIALGAVVLVAVHSAVDFSLQMPAVSLLFATLLGVGCGQAYPTQKH